VFIEFRVTLLAALPVPAQIARDGKQVAFHRWLTDSSRASHADLNVSEVISCAITGSPERNKTNRRTSGAYR
jgi:hypothetical protein